MLHTHTCYELFVTYTLFEIVSVASKIYGNERLKFCSFTNINEIFCSSQLEIGVKIREDLSNMALCAYWKQLWHIKFYKNDSFPYVKLML